MRILVTGAGGPAGMGVSRSLRRAGHTVIGCDADPHTLPFAVGCVRYLVPKASDARYIDCVNEVITHEKADLVMPQPDPEVRALSDHREALVCATFLPSKDAVRIFQDKWLTYEALKAGGVPVPYSKRLDKEIDLYAWDGTLPFWVRARTGAAGRGALLSRQWAWTESWITSLHGWGEFMASDYLPGRLLTWQSVWRHGKLLAGQGRERLEWALANRSPAGVTGITGVARICNDPILDQVGVAAVRAVEDFPHGVYGVDMKCDGNGLPNVTEVNVGRFFTTIQFFTDLDLNFPDLVARAVSGMPQALAKAPEGWCWLRSMDAPPRLLRESELRKAA